MQRGTSLTVVACFSRDMISTSVTPSSFESRPATHMVSIVLPSDLLHSHCLSCLLCTQSLLRLSLLPLLLLPFSFPLCFQLGLTTNPSTFPFPFFVGCSFLCLTNPPLRFLLLPLQECPLNPFPPFYFCLQFPVFSSEFLLFFKFLLFLLPTHFLCS